LREFGGACRPPTEQGVDLAEAKSEQDLTAADETYRQDTLRLAQLFPVSEHNRPAETDEDDRVNEDVEVDEWDVSDEGHPYELDTCTEFEWTEDCETED